MRSSRVLLAGVGSLLAAAILLTADTTAFAAKKDGSSVKSVSSIPHAQILKASRTVDLLIEADYVKHKIKPNPISRDDVFVRRIYLDVVGRIPTYAEAVAFLDSTDSNKRAKLIDKLLDSEGYVSHSFNYWADLLRIRTRMRYAPSQPYIDFVKNSLRTNKPYDQFVRELVTAEGYTWDNGAAGYYLRDTGMPLDNMSNTAQVFLGTQLVCAQCHNHPFDSWTQKQYYQLAAFTYGVQTRDRRQPKFMELRRMYGRRRRGEPAKKGQLDREVYRAASRIMRPLAYRVNETDRKLQLPKDYQYDDAKPRQRIDAATIFGPSVTVKPGDSRKDIYARWMTSPTNPRFTAVIANRLWKRVMGIGLVEPVDDFKDGVKPSNPALMKFLVKQMIDLKYNLKQYQRILFNSKTYQREVTTAEVGSDETYYFPGPVLRRLSAEQLWDSLLTATIPDVDERKGLPSRYGRYTDGKYLVDKELKEILVMARVAAKRRKAQVKYVQMTRDLQKKLRVASRTQDREKVNSLRQEMNKIRRQVFGDTGQRRQRNRARQRRRDPDPRWRNFSRQLVRASEVQSPARPGHFLRQFGQSDRE
ncbi:MAG: DUF1549 domain-containing protein, partial [Planctomycetes bacterium]|nr:DUF1549 domain-containing protein [Planctomycetota bacterium]